jgi:trehalose synthase
MTRMEDYREVAPPGAVDVLLRLAERVRGRRILHVSGSRFGAGAPEILRAAVPLLNELGLDARWEITTGDPDAYATARALRDGLGGAERVLADEALAHWVETTRATAKKLALGADLVLTHDVPPVSLVSHRTEGRWVWRCHFDCSRAQRRAWSFLRQFIAQHDAAVFSLPEFGRRLTIPQFIVAPALDPLSEKHRELSPREVATVLATLRVGQDKPLLVQVGPLHPSRDPLAVLLAYRLVKKHHDVRVVLAGPAGEDRESAAVLAELREAARHDLDIVVVELPAEAHREINALQRAATVALQMSAHGEFGLEAAEALWKGKPVVGGVSGGLSQLILPEVTGYTVHSPEGAAFRIRHLLNHPELVARMGAAGREHVRRAFLITRHLAEELALLVHLTG